MGTDLPLLIWLDSAGEYDEEIVGGKAAKLARLVGAGYRVPRGFCLTTRAYELFLAQAEISAAIRMELGRKSMDDMRWEEVWDAALRIRSTFLAQSLSPALRQAINEGLAGLDSAAGVAVRSSAIGEDSAGRSFAGLHESIIGVREQREVEDAVRLVWASLWSDAALLYRKELGLDPARSRMAVLVQELVQHDRSGVAFARDPRDPGKDLAIIESVPGPCSLLVDGLVDPDRWEINRHTGGVLTWLPGEREEPIEEAPLLEPRDLEEILETLIAVERLFRWAPDMEWSGRSAELTVLQARPITTAIPEQGDRRDWYMTLRPGDARLKALRDRVANHLIPELESECRILAQERLEDLDDSLLVDALVARAEAVARWKQIYWDEFIPFAHGVRRLATYYNDAVKPEDPYEFVGLLRDQPLLAAQRNRALGELADRIGSDKPLWLAIERLLEERAGSLGWQEVRDSLTIASDGARDFVLELENLGERFLDISYDHERLRDRPEPLLRNLLELAHHQAQSGPAPGGPVDSASKLEQRLLDAVGPDRQEEAVDIIDTGRISWKLRDDDNLLIAQLESQLLRAVQEAESRLRDRGLVSGSGRAGAAQVEALATALRDPSTGPVGIEATEPPERSTSMNPPGETPRQLIGQPASPGMSTGRVKCIRSSGDLGAFRQGEVLVCDAIQPTMTHLVPLASAIIERRGGMLIHGAIIARELGIPCVNGVRNAADILQDGDLVTVDGHLGIVTVGPPEFDLELL